MGRTLRPTTERALAGQATGQCQQKWHTDETYGKGVGRWCYLYRAIDADGTLVDSMLSETLGIEAVKRFFMRAEEVVRCARQGARR